MANCSDAFGTFKVEKVGKEFLEFVKEVQKDAYWNLVEDQDISDVKQEEDISFQFSTMGRWSYEATLDGYLKGEWSNWTLDSPEKKAYDKLMQAISDKNGVIVCEYEDSDGAMGWKGKGEYRVFVNEGTVDFYSSFDEEEYESEEEE